MGQLLTNLNLIGSAGYAQCLFISIDGHEIYAFCSSADHTVHHVVPGAAHADYFNIDHGIRTGLQAKCHKCCLLLSFVKKWAVALSLTDYSKRTNCPSLYCKLLSAAGQVPCESFNNFSEKTAFFSFHPGLFEIGENFYSHLKGYVSGGLSWTILRFSDQTPYVLRSGGIQRTFCIK